MKADKSDILLTSKLSKKIFTSFCSSFWFDFADTAIMSESILKIDFVPIMLLCIFLFVNVPSSDENNTSANQTNNKKQNKQTNKRKQTRKRHQNNKAILNAYLCLPSESFPNRDRTFLKTTQTRTTPSEKKNYSLMLYVLNNSHKTCDSSIPT